MTTVNDDWRSLLSDPPKPRTFAELMRMIILMAIEDSDTIRAEWGIYAGAQAEFEQKVGYDIYAEALAFLDAPIFEGRTKGEWRYAVRVTDEDGDVTTYSSYTSHGHEPFLSAQAAHDWAGPVGEGREVVRRWHPFPDDTWEPV